MHIRFPLVLGLSLLAGCQPNAPPPPPVVPMAEDLSTWSVPELVQPPLRGTRAPQSAPNVPAGPAEKVVEYAPGTTVEIPVALGQPLDIILEAGETVRQIVDGDRAPAEQGQARRWEVREGMDQSGPVGRPHVFVTVTDAGLSNGLTITTSRRTYYVTCKSVQKSSTRALRWHYAAESTVAQEPPDDVPSLLPHPEQPMRYHIGYTMTSNRTPLPVWAPRYIADDGRKLYLVYPEVTLFETIPLVRMRGVAGPQLVNSRQYLNVIILDQLAPTLELRVGVDEAAEVVTITRGKEMRTITCPDDGKDCPLWPAAARALARRTP